MKLTRGIVLLLFGGMLLSACEDPAPIRLGFIATLSGGDTATGDAALKGLKLAASEINKQGGIDGRMIELLPRDDQRTPNRAHEIVSEFKDRKVTAIIGPIISSIAVAMLPLINEYDIVTISPTVSAAEFAGFHDNLFRMNTTTRENARAYARHNIKQGRTRVAIALDGQNEAFTESWYREFLLEFDKSDGRVISKRWFNVDDIALSDVAERLLADRPDAIILLASSEDTGKLAREIRKRDDDVTLSTAGWGATESLIERDGDVVEGMEVLQTYDRYDTNPRFLKFVADYKAMFNETPGYTSVLTYDAATVLFAAMKARAPEQTLADALLTLPPQPGLNQELKFDQYGDGQRNLYLLRIENGRFVRQNETH